MIEFDSRKAQPLTVLTRDVNTGKPGVAVPESPLKDKHPYLREIREFLAFTAGETTPRVTLWMQCKPWNKPCRAQVSENRRGGAAMTEKDLSEKIGYASALSALPICTQRVMPGRSMKFRCGIDRHL